MPRKSRIGKELEMADAVERHLKRKAKVIVGREVKFGRGRLDLVAYDKNERIFKIIECKLHSRPTSPGRTFGQLVTYLATMRGRIPQFLDAASRKLPGMRYGRWMEATSNRKKIKVAFYVALTEKACKQQEFQDLREQYPHIGVIRVKPNGVCRDRLPRSFGARRAKDAQAVPKTFSL